MRTTADNLVERAQRYVRTIPGAIAGAGGHNQTFAVACKLVEFGLSPNEAWPLLAEFNLRCQPSWSEWELRHKLEDAFRRAKPSWPTIKAAYLSGEGSLRTLAERFGVSFHTLAKRAKRESWTAQMAKLCDTVTTKAMDAATKHGEKLGLTAAGFVERSIVETCRWLDRIEALAKSDELDADKLKRLVDAWRATVTTGRAAFRLDEVQQDTPLVRVELMATVRPLNLKDEKIVEVQPLRLANGN